MMTPLQSLPGDLMDKPEEVKKMVAAKARIANAIQSGRALKRSWDQDV